MKINEELPSKCERCNSEEKTFKKYVDDDSEIGWHKEYLCGHCAIASTKPVSDVSFSAIGTVLNYRHRLNDRLFDYFTSFKIYAFNDSRETYRGPFAFAIVSNGDYKDIKEAHINAYMQYNPDYVPDIYTIEQVKDIARKEYKKSKPTWLGVERMNELNSYLKENT